MPGRRESLIAAIADYLLRHGLADLSLRPLAAATGTSARMLVYYFGSKEKLVAAGMSEIRRRQRALAEDWSRSHPAAGFEEFLRFVWTWIEAREHQAYLRLFLEVLGRGSGGRFAGFARETFEEWVDWARNRFEAGGREAAEASALAILTVSTIRGLALYLAATGDRRGAKTALHAFSGSPPWRRGG